MTDMKHASVRCAAKMWAMFPGQPPYGGVESRALRDVISKTRPTVPWGYGTEISLASWSCSLAFRNYRGGRRLLLASQSHSSCPKSFGFSKSFNTFGVLPCPGAVPKPTPFSIPPYFPSSTLGCHGPLVAVADGEMICLVTYIASQ